MAAFSFAFQLVPLRCASHSAYDYNPADKTITINEEEAAVVRYIFQRYTEGAGGSVIAKELENLKTASKKVSVPSKQPAALLQKKTVLLLVKH